MAVSSLRERLSRLQGKTRSAKSVSKQTPKPPTGRGKKKSFFNPDNPIDEGSLHEDTQANDIPNLNFPDIDTSQPPSPLSVIKVANRLSKRYLFPQISNSARTPANAGLSLLSANSKTSKISRQYPSVFIQDQLYAVFKQQETLIDRLVIELVSDLKLRIFNMNFENFSFNILVVNDEYTRILNNAFTEKEKSMKERFIELVDSDPLSNQISIQSLVSADLNPSTLISKGLICISSTDCTSSSSDGVYNLTLPHLGGLLRVVKNSAKWVTTTTAKTREHLIMSTDLQHLWFKPCILPKDPKPAFDREYFTSERVGVAVVKEPNTGPGINIVKFRGIGLEWIMALLIGTGIIETYQSPVGIVYKSTGKHL